MRNPAPGPRGPLPLLAILGVVLLPVWGCGERARAEGAWPGAAADGGSGDAGTAALSGAQCVHFRHLLGFLPSSPPGFHRLRAVASTGKYGDVTVSEVERVFSARAWGPRAARQVSVRIVDTSLASRMAEAVRGAAQEAQAAQAAAVGAQDEEARTAPLLFDSAVGYVRYHPEDGGRMEAMLLVGERFLVAVTGRGFGSRAETRELLDGVLQEIDLQGLTRLARPSIALSGG